MKGLDWVTTQLATSSKELVLGTGISETKDRCDHLCIPTDQPKSRQQSITMSWVRQAIDDVKAQSYEELYPTAYGGSSEKPDVSPTTLTLTPSR